MEIVYVYHSCFLIRDDNHIIIFDLPSTLGSKEITFIKDIIRDRELTLLFSHVHSDHFNPNFLSLRELVHDIRCIISYDIAEIYKRLAKEHIVVRPGDLIRVNKLKIKVFNSSDQGVSYVLGINNSLLYFAGDNANWARNELSQEINMIIREKFMETIEQIARTFRRIDVVFTPICTICEDLGGITYISRKLRPELLIPIHLGGQTWILKYLESTLKDLAGSIFLYEKLGDKILFQKSND